MTQHDDIHEAGSYSRRRFLGTLGVGAVAVGTGGAVRLGTAHAATPAAAPTRHVAPALTTHFGRMFERLPAFADPGSHGLEAALVELGSPEGVLDARDALSRGPVQLITDPSLSAPTTRTTRRTPPARPSSASSWTTT